MKEINLENPSDINLTEEDTPFNESAVEFHIPEEGTLDGELPELDVDLESFDNLDEFLLSA